MEKKTRGRPLPRERRDEREAHELRWLAVFGAIAHQIRASRAPQITYNEPAPTRN